METTKKITKEQLEIITIHQQELSGLLTNIGVLESQKHGFLHKIADINKAIEDFKTELQTEYGSININLKDGSYEEIEEVKK